MLRKILSLTLSLSLLFQYSGFAQTINLADYLSQSHNPVALDRFRPLSLRYFSYEPAVDNFKILLDKGDQKDLSDIKIKDEADRLLTYFKIGLSLPNEKFWVNLRPDAEDQIIDPALEKTDLGKVLLEADLQLKKDTSSLTSPQSKEGKVYWEKLYKKAGELFGTENITIPTITRPWIVPGEIIVRESKDSAYIYKAVLKVMLEEDYLTSRGGSRTAPTYQQYAFSDPRLKELNKYSTELIKETILPELTKRINSSKDYANLRQVYFSLILARWFKDAFGSFGSIRVPERQSPENSYIELIDSGDLTNLTSKESWSKTAYFNEYKKSFNDGEYNLSEKVHTPTGQAIRRYTSGGAKIIIEKGAIESFVGNSSPATRKDMVAITLSSPLQKRRLEEVIPIIEKILTEISLNKINKKGGKLTSRYTFKINKIEENTAINGAWQPTKDNSLADNLNVWSTRAQGMAGLNHHSLSGPYIKIDYVLYVIPDKTTGGDLIKAISLVLKNEGLSKKVQKEFKEAVERATGVSLYKIARKSGKTSGSLGTIRTREDMASRLKEIVNASKKELQPAVVDDALTYISRWNVPASSDYLIMTVDLLLTDGILLSQDVLNEINGFKTILTKESFPQSADRVKDKSSSAVEGNNKLVEEFNRFDQRLKSGDEKVLDEIVNFYNGITNDNVKRWEFYKWLQNHQSALASKAMPRIGLCWEGIVPELTAIVKGESGYGNPYAAARQLHELYFQETIGGLKAPREVVEAAKNVWREYGQEFMGYVYPVYDFLNAKFPIVEEGKKPGKLVIVRHGETSWSDSVFNKWAGWLNSLITDKGRNEARKAGEQFKEFHFDLAYSSDLSRAKDTLSEFLKGSQQEWIIIKDVPALREKSYGALAGWSRTDAQKAFGDDLYNQYRRAPKGRAPLGENLEDTKERVGRYLLEEILPAIAAGKNVVISAHGNSLRSLLVILKEHTSAKMLSDKEIEKLEVHLSVPIAISFDNKLNHKEMWSNQHSPAEISAFLQSGSPLLEKKKEEFENILAGILSAIKEIKPSKEIDKNLIMLDFKNADDTRREIDAILKGMDSVLDLNGLREKVNAAIVKLLSYVDAGRIDKEIGKLKELYASLNADILADRFYRAGLTKSKLEGITPNDIKPIEIENNFPGLPGSYYVSRYYLLGTITVEGADCLVKVSHFEEGRRPYRIMELVPKDNSGTLEPLIRFRVFDDGIAAEISYAGHKEPKKKDSSEPAWKEAQRKTFAGLFNIQPQNVDRLQKDLVSDVERILNERAKVFSMGKFVVIGSPADEKLSGLVQRLEQANIALSKRHPGLKVTTPLDLVWVKDLTPANEIAIADTIITDPETANKIGERFIPILSSGDTVILQRKKGVSSSLALTEKPEIVGGIDLTQMNILIQPQGGFASSSLDFSLPELSKAEIEAFDLDKELELIQRMASSGIDPIDERLKRYLVVCFARGRTGKEIDDFKLCLEDVFIAQQLDARKTPDGYKEVIVIADTRRYVLKENRLAAGKGERTNLN